MVGPRLSPPFYRSSDGQWLVWVREPTGGRPYLIDTSAHYVLLTLSFCAGRQDLALPLASFWLRLRRAVLIASPCDFLRTAGFALSRWMYPSGIEINDPKRDLSENPRPVFMPGYAEFTSMISRRVRV